MDDEIEDVVGDVKLTESQKSVAMSNVYSMDFTDSGSEKHNSSGMETYVLELDSEDSESSPLQGTVSIINIKDRPAKPPLMNRDIQCEAARKIYRASATSPKQCSILAQETFTQTSKTIIELAESEGAVRKPMDSKTLETQTSFISITENKTIEYRIEVTRSTQNFTKNEIIDDDSGDNSHQNVVYDQMFPNSIDDGSSKFLISETENEKTDDCISEDSSTTKIMNLSNDDSKHNVIVCQDQNDYENTSEFEQSPEVTDIEEDSLTEPRRKVDDSGDGNNDNKNNDDDRVNNDEVNSGDDINDDENDDETDSSITPRSVDNDVAELYNKLSESIDFRIHTPSDHEKKRFGYLTPLTEESAVKKDSLMDLAGGATAIIDHIEPILQIGKEDDQDVLFTNNAGIKVKLFPKPEDEETDGFKLPPIQNHNSSENNNLNFLFSLNNNKVMTKSNLPCVHEERRERNVDRWEIGTKDLASGESPLINGRGAHETNAADYLKNMYPEFERVSHSACQLPPIHVEGFVVSSASKPDHHVTNLSKTDVMASESVCPISIKERIKELKMSYKPRNSWSHSKYNSHVTDSRSQSPNSLSPEERMTDAAERGCELLCVELLKKLRSHSWFEVAESLVDLPRALEKFWEVIAEHRIADLIRQVAAHVESPRTQVARAACTTLAVILKNTNYTKKPDFYEAVTILLIKTGSFSRPVRRAANVALDDIVCSVDLSHAVTALCIHGTSHKSALVRCAAARLLVVCCALGGGGRGLLRARPPTAACARRHALRSLAALLDDKSTDARKYAERLYSMLRPLSNFEAYYLTDVDVDVAARQMKKYDQLLVCVPPESR